MSDCKDCQQIAFLRSNQEKYEKKAEQNFNIIFKKLDKGQEGEKDMLEKLLELERKISGFAIAIIGTIIGGVLLSIITWLIFKK